MLKCFKACERTVLFGNGHFLNIATRRAQCGNLKIPLIFMVFLCFSYEILCVEKIRSRPRGILRVDTIGFTDRGILCVDKIGSPGKPATPCWPLMSPLMWPLIRKNRLPARIRGWVGTATGRHIHVVHISHTPTERAHTDPKIISFGKKQHCAES